ncbi:MAG TPA: DUF2092 domain-containing protein [Candidatus Methylacidiphilales bacterium]
MKRYLAFCLVLASIGSLRADDAAPQLDARTTEILGTTSAYYAGLKTFQADEHVVLHNSVLDLQSKMEVAGDFHIALSRPASFASTKMSGIMGGTLACDGKTATAHIALPVPTPGQNEYVTGPAPADVSELFTLSTKMKYGRVVLYTPLVESLLAKYPFAPLVVSGHTSGTCVGSEKIGETPCDHVSLVTKVAETTTTTDLWFASGAAPLLLRAEVSSVLPGRTFGYSFAFSQWRTNEAVPPEQFAFTPPEGAVQVNDFSMPGRRAETPPWVKRD